MSRNWKVNKEVKIKACEDYQIGKGSYDSISISICVSAITLQQDVTQACFT